MRPATQHRNLKRKWRAIRINLLETLFECTCTHLISPQDTVLVGWAVDEFLRSQKWKMKQKHMKDVQKTNKYNKTKN